MNKIFKVNLFFLILIILQVFGGLFVKPIIKVLHMNIWQSLVLTQVMFLIVPVIIYILVTGQSFLKVLRIKPLSFVSIRLLISISIVSMPIMWFLGYVTSFFFHNNVYDVLEQMKSLPLYALILVIAVLPAFCEELTMRGVVLSGYKDISIRKSAVITGFLFAVLHMNPPQFLYAFVLGIILAYVVDITGSIFSSMICHFIFNGTSALLTWINFKLGTQAQETATISPGVKYGMLVFLLIFSAGCVVLLVLLIKALKSVNNVALIGADEVQSRDEQFEVSEEKSNKLIVALPILISVIIYIAIVFMLQ